jgi:hypothetical protein
MVPSATGRRVLGASMAVIVLVIWSDGCAKSDDPSANGSGGDASPDAPGAGVPASASSSGGGFSSSSGGTSPGGSPSGSGGSGGGGSSSGTATAPDGGAAVAACSPYKDDASFCACMDWNCGGATITSLTDSAGSYVTVYCGSCAASPGTWCEANNPSFTGVGHCGGTNPLVYPFQTGLIHMLEAMGENDTTDYDSEYSYIQNIKDGRGYTIGTVGFCTGTGDFIVVARCLNDLEPSNLLAKYWPGLVAIDDAFYKLDANNADTSPVDKLGSFVADVTSAGTNDKTYRACQDTMADADYLDTALQHAQERGLKGALTIGFLYDTELNFGDQDDPNGVAGAITVMKKADADYGPGVPTDFTGLPWEESRWLGYAIKERTTVMATDPSGTWEQDMDQNATWEAARRLHTGKSNDPESGTDLSMDYDFVSAYKAGAGSAPCWPSLPDKTDSSSSIYDIAPSKTGAESQWTAIDTGNAPDDYGACPANPTP